MTTISDVMTKAVQSVRYSTPVRDLPHLLEAFDVHAAPVVGHDGSLVGIVTTFDLTEDSPGSEPVTTIMSRPVHTVHAETDTATAASLMRRQRINHLVVTDTDDAIVGIVSSWDLLESLAATVRAHTSEAVDVAPVAPGDELLIRRSSRQPARRGRITAVKGLAGLPPYVVVWDDDPKRQPVAIDIVRHGDTALDGCER